MSKYRVRFHTQIEVAVEIDAEDEESAADEAWEYAQEYLDTVHGNGRETTAEATLDGIGADEVTELEAADA